jgi:oligopeptidase A
MTPSSSLAADLLNDSPGLLSTHNNAINNPLLDFSNLPHFDAITPAHAGPALDVLLERAKSAIDEVAGHVEPPSWDNLVEALESPIEYLGRAWGIIGHLNSVADSPEMREAYSSNLPRMSQFWTLLGQHQGLYRRYKALQASADFSTLSPVRQRVITNTLRSFTLAGAALPDPLRSRFAKIQEEQASLAQAFSEHALDSTNAFEMIVTDVKELAGLPDDVVAAAAASAREKGLEGFRFSLQFPSYLPVVKYAQSAALRANMTRAYATKASMNASAPSDPLAREALDNTKTIDTLLQLRDEEAKLLGFNHYADLSLVTKMATSPSQVADFLRDLARRARPFAERDIAELRAFARDTLGMPELVASDRTYASEKLKEERYSFSDEAVKQYFQLPKVLAGLFALVEGMYQVSIQADAAPTWDEAVQFFKISRDGHIIGQFYLDLFARSSKRSGAWMNDCRGRRALGRTIQTPVAYLVCNFMAPATGKPSLLTHDEVITLFHEFGHGLHHMLTRIDELSVSGISGVEWDAVELPSQFMENFCWEWDILQTMTAHVDHGGALPRELYDKMIAAKNFQSGLQTLRQVEFSLFDMRLHAESLFETKIQELPGQAVQAVLDEVRAEVSVLDTPIENKTQNSFSHIFAGGYSAGYYSYKWAEVLSADAYEAFEEARRAPNPSQAVAATGERFLDEILARGGSRPAIDSFRAFRGREPQIDALLRHNGMTEKVLVES